MVVHYGGEQHASLHPPGSLQTHEHNSHPPLSQMATCPQPVRPPLHVSMRRPAQTNCWLTAAGSDQGSAKMDAKKLFEERLTWSPIPQEARAPV